jgi:hypothetical protein
MPSILNNFVALRKTKGDILDPASHRTIIEMILGILKRYNFDEFNTVYQSFIDHLLDFNDPHRVSDASFLEEIIERTYDIYTKMTATPVSELVFRSDIVPSIGFLELIRRIVLNRYLYDRIKNVDGSVPATCTVTLSSEWGHLVSDNVPVTFSFASQLADEDAFIASGWGVNSTPIPVVFNADTLQPVIPQSQCIFHLSPQVPYFGSFDAISGYPIALSSVSNDLSLVLCINGYPILPTIVISLLNGEQTITLIVNPDRALEIRLGTLLLNAPIPCSEGVYNITMTRNGTIEIACQDNGIFESTFLTVDFSNVSPFVTALISAPLSDIFTQAFGIQDLTVSRNIP